MHLNRMEIMDHEVTGVSNNQLIRLEKGKLLNILQSTNQWMCMQDILDTTQPNQRD